MKKDIFCQFHDGWWLSISVNFFNFFTVLYYCHTIVLYLVLYQVSKHYFTYQNEQFFFAVFASWRLSCGGFRGNPKQWRQIVGRRVSCLQAHNVQVLEREIKTPASPHSEGSCICRHRDVDVGAHLHCFGGDPAAYLYSEIVLLDGREGRMKILPPCCPEGLGFTNRRHPHHHWRSSLTLGGEDEPSAQCPAQMVLFWVEWEERGEDEDPSAFSSWGTDNHRHHVDDVVQYAQVAKTDHPPEGEL